METLKDKIKELEREEILKALRESGWVMAKAARKLGITERMIGYKISKYGIRSKEVRWVGTNDNEGTGEVMSVERIKQGKDLGPTAGQDCPSTAKSLFNGYFAAISKREGE